MIVRLGDIAKVTAGQAAPKKFSNEGLPFIRAGHLEELTNGGKLCSLPKVSDDIIKEKRLKRLPKNSILFAKSGMSATKNRIYITEEETCYVSHLAAVLPNKTFDALFLAKFLSWFKPSKLILDSAYPSIRLEDINNLKIPLLPLTIQKQIAEILESAANLRDKTEHLLIEYNALAKSIFLDIFGDPVANQKGWKVHKLKELSTNIGSGNTPKGGSKVYVDEGITFFRSQNVWKNNLLLDDVAYIDKATHDKMKNSSLKNGDILMTKTGRINTENSSLGRAAMYLGEDDKANVNGHVYLIRLKKNVINEYVLFILTTNEYREHIRRVCVGGIDKRQLNKNHLEEFPIIYPPIELQKKFTEKLKLIEQQKILAKQELKESEDLFNCLLQKAFRGELL
ncbi:restriction endonuclease subunit S [Hwangdonia lutea]|uniref:Restriction endonuclease subunit S n=1 Tax=Hwangdonia lutea TaxID=3075823 RepID=A0AA97HRS9_9FLAO|nr:restriction endonuclease subunit S [Hwangdonia sp. SCSIO 19198]WOD44188.1 restriction endonuclease subunit S [Hwangdonia sp. SCSIO 19198]